jgi:hypothetical protein
MNEKDYYLFTLQLSLQEFKFFKKIEIQEWRYSSVVEHLLTMF